MGAVAIGILTLGSATLISGIIAGAVFGGVFGGVSAYANGGNILQGALTGMFIGALGGIHPGAAAAAAAGMTFINNRINGQKASIDTVITAGLSALTAAVFAQVGDELANFILADAIDPLLKVVAGALSGLLSSVRNFVADEFINQFRNQLSLF